MALDFAPRILRVSARAFVSPLRGVTGLEKDGGNPVTIFLPMMANDDLSDGSSISAEMTANCRSKLAQSCTWESIVIEPVDVGCNNKKNTSLTRFRFYMPSGEEVSFCGHAAIGACAFLANQSSILKAADLSSIDFGTSSLPSSIRFSAEDGKYDALVRGNEVELMMDTTHVEADCSQMENAPSLQDFLSEIGLTTDDVQLQANSKLGYQFPTYLNSTVARPKTLICIKSEERLHAATSPTDATKFHQMCDAIKSTGIYLYSHAGVQLSEGDESVFECRQFPKSSGYAEDPATGIAAGALAASLYKRGIWFDSIASEKKNYDMYQGRAMQRPSRIGVKIGTYDEDGRIALSYKGLVAFDSFEYTD